MQDSNHAIEIECNRDPQIFYFSSANTLSKACLLWSSFGLLPEQGGETSGVHDIRTCNKSEELICPKTSRKCNARQKKGVGQKKEKDWKVFLYWLEPLPYSISCVFFNCIYPSPVFGGHVSSVRCKMKEGMLCWESVITLVNWVIHHLKTV